VAIESASWRPILAPQGSGPDGVRSRPPVRDMSGSAASSTCPC